MIAINTGGSLVTGEDVEADVGDRLLNSNYCTLVLSGHRSFTSESGPL